MNIGYPRIPRMHFRNQFRAVTQGVTCLVRNVHALSTSLVCFVQGGAPVRNR